MAKCQPGGADAGFFISDWKFAHKCRWLRANLSGRLFPRWTSPRRSPVAPPARWTARLAANQTVFTNVPLAGVVVQSGQELFLHWMLARPGSGSSPGVAIDNLTVSFQTAGSSPPLITTQPQSEAAGEGGFALFIRHGQQQSVTEFSMAIQRNQSARRNQFHADLDQPDDESGGKLFRDDHESRRRDEQQRGHARRRAVRAASDGRRD